MASWDIFHSDRLEVEREISTEAVRAGLASKAITVEDLVRPSGVNAPWTRIGDRPKLFAEPEPTLLPTLIDEEIEIEIELEEVDKPESQAEKSVGPLEVGEHDVIRETPSPIERPDSYGEFDLSLREKHDPNRPVSSKEVITWDDDLDEEPDPQDEDEAAAEFTLARGRSETVEELDLAAMVDVAFQLVLFFLVTATTVLYKSLEVPKPNHDSRPPRPPRRGVQRISTT